MKDLKWWDLGEGGLIRDEWWCDVARKGKRYFAFQSVIQRCVPADPGAAGRVQGPAVAAPGEPGAGERRVGWEDRRDHREAGRPEPAGQALDADARALLRRPRGPVLRPKGAPLCVYPN